MAENTSFPTKIVLDASVILNYLMPDENTPPEIDQLIKKLVSEKSFAIAPTIINYEVANSLRSALLSKRLTAKVAFKIYTDYANIGVIVREVDHLQVLKLATRKNISVYDASYVYVSRKYDIPFLSLDERLFRVVTKKLRFPLPSMKRN